MAILVAFAVGLPLIAAHATGAIDVPRNDDWSYSRTALTLAGTGELHLVGWAVMSLVAQTLWAQPWLATLGESLRTLHLATAVASTIGLVATFLLARRFLAPASALLVAAIVAVAPAYAVGSTSFMTDPLAFAGQICAVALAAGRDGGTPSSTHRRKSSSETHSSSRRMCANMPGSRYWPRPWETLAYSMSPLASVRVQRRWSPLRFRGRDAEAELPRRDT
ncbi:MAG: hypothetical protein H0V93_16660 [Euzebyales bacterium]|nr:hypothetical protein [Euzebyales bacterium]